MQERTPPLWDFQHLIGERKKTNKHKEFWRDTPWCASRLSRGHVPSVPSYVPSVPGTFCPFSIDLHINQAQMSQVFLGRPEFVPGTPPGHPTAKFLYVIVLYRFFSLLTDLKCHDIENTIAHNDFWTELLYFQIIFGNSCSVITEPNCFWNYLLLVRSVSRGLPNPWPNCFRNSFR